MTLKPLGIVKQIVEEAGMGVSYAYEDLVFLEHNSYLLQFADNNQEVLVHVNQEADKATVGADIARLQDIARNHEIHFVTGDIYSLSQDDDENIRLEFYESN